MKGQDKKYMVQMLDESSSETDIQHKNINIHEQANSRQNYKKQITSLERLSVSFPLAQRHGKVFCLYDTPEDSQGAWQCECCGRKSKSQSINMLSDSKNLSFLGSVYPMYFDLMKMIFIFLAIVLLISGIFNISSSKDLDACLSQSQIDEMQKKLKQNFNLSAETMIVGCHKNWITTYSLGNKGGDEKSLFTQEILNMCTVFVLILFIHFIARRQRIIENMSDKESHQPDSFTVLISEIPISFDSRYNNYDTSLREYIETQMNLVDFSGKPINLNSSIEKITFCFNIDKLLQLEKQKADLMIYKQLELNKTSLNNQEVQKLESAIFKVGSDIQLLKQSYTKNRSKEFMSKYFTGQAFITFKFESVTYRFIEAVNRRSQCFSKPTFLFQNKKLTFEEAPQPDDIDWSEMYSSQEKKFTSLAVFHFIYCLLAALGIFAFVYLAKVCIFEKANYNKRLPTSESVADIHLTSVGMAILLYSTNMIFYLIITKFTEYFNFHSRTRKNTLIANLTILQQVITTVILPFAVYAIIADGQPLYNMLYSQTGLAILESYIFVLYTLIPIVLCLFDFQYIYKRIMRYLAINDGTRCNLNQQQLGKLFEEPEFDLSYQYSQIIRTIYATMFYAPMIPMCTVWSLGSILFQYIITKYQLIYRRAVVNRQSSSLGFNMILHLPITLVVFSLCSFCFHRISDPLEQNKLIPSAITLCISIFNLIFVPLFKVNSMMFSLPISNQNGQSNRSYHDLQQSFRTEYDKENPAINMYLLQSSDRTEHIKGSRKDEKPPRNPIQQNHGIVDYKMAERNKQYATKDQKSMFNLDQDYHPTTMMQSLQKSNHNLDNNNDHKGIKSLQQLPSLGKIITIDSNKDGDHSGQPTNMISQISKQVNFVKDFHQNNREQIQISIQNNQNMLNWVNQYQQNYQKNTTQQSYRSEYMAVENLKVQLEQIQKFLYCQAEFQNQIQL